MKLNSHGKSNFKVSCTAFQSELRNFSKSSVFTHFVCILNVFEGLTFLTEKQCMKPYNLTYWKNFASFDTLLVTGSTKVVEIEIMSRIVSFEMILRSNTPECLSHFNQERFFGNDTLSCIML